jgi:hypothetical protein
MKVPPMHLLEHPIPQLAHLALLQRLQKLMLLLRPLGLLPCLQHGFGSDK